MKNVKGMDLRNAGNGTDLWGPACGDGRLARPVLRDVGWTGQRPVPTQLLLGFGLLLSVGGFDGRTDAGQHLFSRIGKGAVGL